MAQAPVFRATSGLNNVIEPHRLKYGEDGGCPLAEAVNVVVDDSGSVRRRVGRVKVLDGAVSSLWTHKNFCIFVHDGQLKRLYANGSIVTLVSGIIDPRTHYAWFQEKVFVKNASFAAIVDDATVIPWTASVPVLAKTDTRTLGMPSSFSEIFSFSGKLYLIDGKFLWESVPFNGRCFDLGSGYLQLGGEILGAQPLTKGVYVSDDSGVFFLSGKSFSEFSVQRVSSFPAIPGTFIRVAGHELGDGMDGEIAMWACDDGVMIGSDDGLVKNVTNRRINFRDCISGASVFFDGKVLLSLEVN